MKKILIIFFIFLFQFNFAIANTIIAFIDMNKIIATSKPGSSIMKQLRDINSVNLSKFKSETKKLKEQEAKIVSQKNILSETDFRDNIKKLKLEVNNYNVNKDQINSNFNKNFIRIL